MHGGTGAMTRNLPQVIFAARIVLASLSEGEMQRASFSSSALLSVRDLCWGCRQRPPFAVNKNQLDAARLDVQLTCAVQCSFSLRASRFRLPTSSLAFKQ